MSCGGGVAVTAPPGPVVTPVVIHATMDGMSPRLAWITGIALVLLAAVTVLGAVGALVPGVLGDPVGRAVFGVVALVGLAGVVGTLVEIVRIREDVDTQR